MKNKYFWTILLSLTLLAVQAQDLATKIPKEALVVASVKSNNFFDLLSIEKFNSSVVGEKTIKELFKNSNKAYNSIEDTGVDLMNSAYYFNMQTDSIQYNCVLIPIKDVEKFSNLFKSSTLQVSGTTRTITDDSNIILKWNDQFALFITGNLKTYFFDNKEIAAHYGLTYNKPYNYDYYENAYPTVDSIAVDESHYEDYEETGVAHHAEKPPVYEDYENEENFTIPEISEDKTDLYKDYETKSRLESKWTKLKANELFFSNNKTSILTNSSYLKSIDNKAIASLWVSNFGDFYNYFIPSTSYYFSKSINFTYWYHSMQIKLFMKKDQARMTYDMDLNKDIAESYKKIYNKKINKKFFKYINEDKTIAYMGYSMDTKAYLEEFPKMIHNIYLNTLFGFENYKDEAELASDLFSLILDEKAVSKVIKGDGLFILTDISQKDVPYIDYQYNDDYEYIEIEKTKKETLPDFLFMVSSDDTKLTQKLMHYGVKKNVLTTQDNIIYEVAPIKRNKNNIISMYMTIKDNIFFFGTSFTDMQNIKNNRFKSTLSSKHKKLLSQNYFSGYFSPKKLNGKLNDIDEIKDLFQSMKLNTVLSKSGDIYTKGTPIKGNTLSGEVIIETPDNNKNSLEYLFSLIDSLKN